MPGPELGAEGLAEVAQLATRRAAELDAEILMKPVDLRDLLTVVERHCRRGLIRIQ